MGSVWGSRGWFKEQGCSAEVCGNMLMRGKPNLNEVPLKQKKQSPDQAAQLVKALSPHAKISGLVPDPGTYED